MLRIRTCEEGFVDPILSGEIKCPVHLCSGEEAIATGVCSALKKDDHIFGNHRSHGHYLAKGGDLKKMVAEVYCKETGCSKGRGGSMHLIDVDAGVLGSAPIVAGTISLALGAGLASSISKSGSVVATFFGDGATGEGVLCESLNFAALKKLPIIFVCENNLYSTHLPIDEIRVNRDIYQLGEPFGVRSLVLDGNSVLEVYEKAQDAVEYCRSGKGPVLLECKTYRQRGHVGPDDNIQGSHTDIRPESEVEEWLQKDPIKRLERYMLENSVADSEELSKIQAAVTGEVADAFKAAAASAFPDKSEVAKYVYSK
jgi:pyruvate dehydrogenase E1 component alpha subunit